MPNLVGIGNSQVPTNAMLGGLAYQDPAHANLTNVEIENIEKIKAEVVDTANRVFVYDTRNDSDGGAWRKRCQGKSWYNEELGTIDRGHRKEFPAVAVLVLTDTSLIIYDGDDPNMSMWMRFRGNGQVGAHSNMLTSATGTRYTCVHALNASICVGCNDTDGSPTPEGLYEINFISERARVYRESGSGHTGSFYQGNIANRNSKTLGGDNQIGTGSLTYYGDDNGAAIYDQNVLDVSMHVDNGAPIDPNTGLPRPIIGVASQEAVTIIKTPQEYISGIGTNHADGNAFLRTEDEASYDGLRRMRTIDFDKDGRALWNSSQIAAGYQQAMLTKANAAQYMTFNSNYGHNGIGYGFSWAGNIIRTDNLNTATSTIGYWAASATNRNDAHPFFAGDNIAITSNGEGVHTDEPANSITLIDKKSLFQSNPLICGIGTNYNTGWYPAQSNGLWLCDIDQSTIGVSTVTGTNMLSNAGTFDAALDGSWGGNATLTLDSNRLKIHSDGGVNYYTYQTVTTVTNKKYVISFTCSDSSSSAVWLRIGTSGATSVQTLNCNNHGAFDNYAYSFKAGGTSTSITFMVTVGIDGRYTIIDNVYLQEAQEFDRSRWTSLGGGQSARVHGSVTKKPVGKNSDLVYYTNFGASDYIEIGNVESDGTVQAGSPNDAQLMDWGTGDHFISAWFWCTNVGGGQFIFKKGDSGRETELWIASDLRYVAFYIDGAQYNSGSGAYNNEAWNHVVAGRQAGNVLMYINGIQRDITTAVTNSTADVSTNYSATIGESCNTNTRLALLSCGPVFPTADAIKKMYQENRKLFSDNVKCTLYGGEKAIPLYGADYDEKTGLMHFGTSEGRSDFDGIRRINNTTVGITTTLSASGGLIAEK